MLQLRLIDFSPEDRFMATFSPVEPANPREKAGLVLNLFDTRTGRKLRAFEGSADDFAVGAAADPTGALRWPVFKWAGGCGDRCGVLAWQLRKMRWKLEARVATVLQLLHALPVAEAVHDALCCIIWSFEAH